MQTFQSVAACLGRFLRPVGPVEGDDEFPAQPLVVWILGDQPPQIADDLLMAAEGEVRGDPGPDHIAVQLVESLHVRGGKRVIGDVGECLAAP